MRSKKDCQKAHMKRRVRQRFGIDLNRHDLAEIVSRIQSGQSEFIDRRSLRTARHRLEVKGTTIDVIYDKSRQTVVSALYPEIA